ncbi:ATP-binding cassette domain-containing protein [Candidatus Fermentibacterales bacterium]|nr:ATP-binding cassette domain-containing protein [Candidatus Fermentibacterales bacterium]
MAGSSAPGGHDIAGDARGPVPIVIAEGVGRSFGDLVVLKDLDFALNPGEFVAIVGKSGCGKSTLLSILGTHDLGFTGSLAVDGVDVAAASRPELSRIRREVIGFVFQDFHLLPNLSPLENVLLPAVFSGLDDQPRIESARQSLLYMGIRVQDQPSSLLSRGERQRVAVARGLQGRPRVLLADEPTASLDEQTETMLFDMLDSLRREQGFALLSVVHSTRVLDRADRVLELQGGKLRESH